MAKKRCVIRLGEHTVELRRTLSTLRRIKEATGVPAGEWGEKLAKGEIDEAEGLTVTLWALIPHDENVGKLSLEGMANLVDLDDIGTISDAISAAWGGSVPPPAARGARKAASPRKR